MERVGARPALVEGREDNLKVTTAADLRLIEFLLANSDPDPGLDPGLDSGRRGLRTWSK